MKKAKTVKVDFLARVEGEGGIYVKVKDQEVVEVRVDIFEPPRFFEAFLRGRKFTEAPDITARICGICPVAYQTSSVQAMEQACGVTVDGQIRALRRLLYCGEWIESHALHVFMLHAPDFLGYEDAIQLAKDHPDIVNMALKLKKLGNDIMIGVGGREIHPVNVRVGGFYRAPRKAELLPCVERLKWARDEAYKACKFLSTLTFPEYEYDYEFVSLRHPKEYPITEGRIVSSKGLDIAVNEYESHFLEEHIQHSNALHSQHKNRGNYHVGPLARYALNFDHLPDVAKDAAKQAGLGKTCNNPFKSILVRAVETVFACDESIRLINDYVEPDPPAIEVTPKAATGCGASEAPRGMLYHRYAIDAQGFILNSKIVPPTSQNLRTIEEDLRQIVPSRTDLPDDKLTWLCEQAVRNYDPCISCATHALKVKLDRD